MTRIIHRDFTAYESNEYLYFYNDRGHFIFKVNKNMRPVGSTVKDLAIYLIDEYLGDENEGIPDESASE